MDIKLTKTEKIILDYLAHGYDTHTICEQRVITESTLRTHIYNIFLKFGITGDNHLPTRVRVILSYLKMQGYLPEDYIIQGVTNE